MPGPTLLAHIAAAGSGDTGAAEARGNGPRVAAVACRARGWRRPLRDLSRDRRHFGASGLHRVLGRRAGADRSSVAAGPPSHGDRELDQPFGPVATMSIAARISSVTLS